MANSGFKQAVIAYRVRSSDGAPLDINGVRTSISGRRQAIAVLVGTTNPNPAIYEVQLTYLLESAIDGTPTVKISDDCPTGYIFVVESHIVLQPSAPSKTVRVASSAPWVLTSLPPGGIVTIDIISGNRGETILTLSRTANIGQGIAVFTNSLTGQTAELYVVNVTSIVWILETGQWNELGIWLDNGIWNY